MHKLKTWKTILLSAACLSISSVLRADNIRITIESQTPSGGTSLTPVWLGFHDGEFDSFNAGESASVALEQAAEDGNFAALRSVFSQMQSSGKDLVLTGMPNPNGPPLLFPKSGNQTFINLDPSNPSHHYLSFLAMLLPSNDAFIGNDDPMSLPIYNADGSFVGGTWDIMGSMVYDAGTEVNDEVKKNVPMLGQMAPNTGTTEGGVVRLHDGFHPSGNVLNAFPGANFKTDDYVVVRIIVEKIPERHTSLEIEIQNLAPDMGTLLTPFWVGLHDGSFDAFSVGESASEALERIAEDGNPETMRGIFASGNSFGWDTVVTGPENPAGPPLFFPGQSRSYFVNVDANNPSHSHLSFVSMLLPSNDAFIGNDDPTAHRIFESGVFVENTIKVYGSNVYDAGTEMNDEAAQNVPVLGQMAPNSGETEGGVVAMHPGFVEGGSILSMFPYADFTSDHYMVAQVSVIKRFNPWEGIPLNSEGLRDSPIFGIVDDSNFPWVEHRHHGPLLFQRAGSIEGFWVYNPQGDLGWIFTSESYYPQVYRQADSTWYRYELRSANPRRFENLATGEILEVE